MEIIVHAVQTGGRIDPMIHQTRIHILYIYNGISLLNSVTLTQTHLPTT